MRGMEYGVILGLIIIIAIIFLIVIIVFIPALSFGETTVKQVSFREFCVFWSLNGYMEGRGQVVERDSILYGCPAGCSNYPNYCPAALGKLFEELTDDDVEDCRNICRLKV